MAVYSFAVSRSSLGIARPETLVLAWVDTKSMTVDPDDAIPLQPGHDYLLFLEKLTRADRGGMQELGTTYTPVGSNAGVFPIVSGQAVATDRTYDRVLRTDPAKNTAPPLSLDPRAALALRTKSS